MGHVVIAEVPASRNSRAWRVRCALGLALIAFWWPIAWLQVQPLSDYYFFPLWLGYILAVDGFLEFRTGTSPIARRGAKVTWMFVASIPLWWTFELFNQVVQNWDYHLPRSYSSLQYALLASLAFSTVVPAVLTTCELVRSLGLNPLRRLPALVLSARTLAMIFASGIVMVILTMLWPEYAFPLVWLSLIFVLDPLAAWLGARSITWHLRQGDWSPVLNLGVATLICGFFWELWNIYALPKWTYNIPYADWVRIFEMPLLGYGGYIPFGVEVFTMYAIVGRLFRRFEVPEARVSVRQYV